MHGLGPRESPTSGHVYTVPPDLSWCLKATDTCTFLRLSQGHYIVMEMKLPQVHFYSSGASGVNKQKETPWASLVVQWLRICLPMQGTRVRALVWEDPTCRGATGPVSHNY